MCLGGGACSAGQRQQLSRWLCCASAPLIPGIHTPSPLLSLLNHPPALSPLLSPTPPTLFCLPPLPSHHPSSPLLPSPHPSPHPTLPSPPLPCREWVASEDGEALATQLISVLVAEHLSASGAHNIAFNTPPCRFTRLNCAGSELQVGGAGLGAGQRGRSCKSRSK